eukprot:2585735-Rhodomonas_salina.1
MSDRRRCARGALRSSKGRSQLFSLAATKSSREDMPPHWHGLHYEIKQLLVSDEKGTVSHSVSRQSNANKCNPGTNRTNEMVTYISFRGRNRLRRGFHQTWRLFHPGGLRNRTIQALTHNIIHMGVSKTEEE